VQDSSDNAPQGGKGKWINWLIGHFLEHYEKTLSNQRKEHNWNVPSIKRLKNWTFVIIDEISIYQTPRLAKQQNFCQLCFFSNLFICIVYIESKKKIIMTTIIKLYIINNKNYTLNLFSNNLIWRNHIAINIQNHVFFFMYRLLETSGYI
jgi:hypothetical protein